MRDKILTFPPNSLPTHFPPPKKKAEGSVYGKTLRLGQKAKLATLCWLQLHHWLTGKRGGGVQSAMILGLYGCVLAVKNMSAASPTGVHISTVKRPCNADLCTNTPNLAAAGQIPCMQQIQTPENPCVHAANGAQGMVAWQDTFTEKETTLKSSLLHWSVYT